MDWVESALKFFVSSKLWVRILFLSSALLLFVPKFFTDIEPLEAPYRGPAWIVLVITGVATAWWFIEALIGLLRSARTGIGGKLLSGHQKALLLYLADKPLESVERNGFTHTARTPLQVQADFDKLIELGLLNHGYLGGLYLSEKGRQVALKIQTKHRGK